MDDLRTVAVILAGGTGTRVGLDVPKQLLKVAGKTILEHTLDAFDRSAAVDEILILMAPGHLDPVREILRAGRHPKVSTLLEGGSTRAETTQRAVDALGDDECNLLIHDAVRPLISQSVITACVDALRVHQAVDTAVPTADTIIRVDEDGFLVDVPPRHELRRGQTPQGFRLSVLREAYRRAALDPAFVATDDCTVVLRHLPEVPIAVVPGEASNMKVTEPIDIHIADKLFQLTSRSTDAPVTDDTLRAALTGRTVVVLGGSHGIGAGIVDLAASFGARVHAFSRSLTGTHVERPADLAEVARTVLAADGRIDHVVCTAGLLTLGDLVDTHDEGVWAATETNYLAPVFIAREFHPHLAATRGSMLTFTSSSYTRGRQGYALYSSAKAAVVNLTQALADEWKGVVRINCINPERTATPMRTAAFGAEDPTTLLGADVVARQSLEVLVSDHNGHVVDVRR